MFSSCYLILVGEQYLVFSHSNGLWLWGWCHGTWELGDFLGLCDANSDYSVNNTYNGMYIELDEEEK